MPQAAAARPAGGALAEAHAVPAAAAERCQEVPGGGGGTRPAGRRGASGHVDM